MSHHVLAFAVMVAVPCLLAVLFICMAHHADKNGRAKR